MTRRGFLYGMIQAGVACMALPSALTYARQWKRQNDVFVPSGTFIQGFDLGDLDAVSTLWFLHDGMHWEKVR